MIPTDGQVEKLRSLARAPEFMEQRYSIERELGVGGMGSVYVALDTMLQRQVAIKVVHPGDDTERLLAEARTLAQLEHPGIVPIHDAGLLTDGRVYYAMKFVDGKRLDAFVVGTALSERLRVFLRIVEAVAFAHSLGVPHRDLKPHNVMVGQFGEVLVLDWGQPGMGTPGWMPLEGSGTMLADIFALGLILRLLTEEFVEPPLRAIAKKASHTSPDERYQSASALRAEVIRFLDQERVLAFKENWWQQGTRLADRNRTALALVAAYLLLRLALIFLMGR